MLDAAGTPLPTHDALPSLGVTAPADAGTSVILDPGDDASFTITYSDGSQLPPSASCPTSSALAVTPEGSPRPVIFSYSIEAFPYIQGEQCGSVIVGEIGR